MTSGPNCSTNSLQPKGSNRGWFFHFSADNVALVSISPDDSAAGETGELGVRLRVQELEGRRTRGVLRCFRQVESAQLVDWRQPPLPALSMRDGDIELELGGYQLVELMITWA